MAVDGDTGLQIADMTTKESLYLRRSEKPQENAGSCRG